MIFLPHYMWAENKNNKVLLTKCGPMRFLLTKCGPYLISVVPA